MALRSIFLLTLTLVACVRDEPATVDSRLDYAQERTEMIETDIAGRGIRDPLVLAAMREVPRHAFVPPSQVEFAYEDRPLPIGEGQTISQPYIVALMTEALQLTPTSRVLEIGTGSGYQAAVLAEITPHIWTIEIVERLGERAAEDLKMQGYDTVRCRIGDGYRGWPEEAPFDAIIVTAAPGFVPPALLDQLAPTGCLVIPVGEEYATQELLRITKDERGREKHESLGAVRFVPMTGKVRGR
jgi:protein-L-isoaspartate(D-aspartate) O-methyltransferase